MSMSVLFKSQTEWIPLVNSNVDSKTLEILSQRHTDAYRYIMNSNISLDSATSIHSFFPSTGLFCSDYIIGKVIKRK